MDQKLKSLNKSNSQIEDNDNQLICIECFAILNINSFVLNTTTILSNKMSIKKFNPPKLHH